MLSNRGSDDSPWRNFVPSSVIGLAVVVFFMGIAAAFTGAVLYAYYESSQERTENKLEDFVGGFDDSIEAAKAIIQEEGETALEDLREQLPGFAATGETLSDLLARVSPSVWFVATLDEAGGPSVGSAFVVFSDSQQSFLMTSFTTVAASTTSPGPEILLRNGNEEVPASVSSVDQALDVALLVIDRPDLPPLPWADADQDTTVGDRVFAVSGLGSAGGSVSQGFVADVAANGIQHDAAVGTHFQGGPLLDADGEVLAVTSRAYSPLGFNPQAVFFAPPVRSTCGAVLQCPPGTPNA